ncbi:MAG: hypothetical protein PSX36_14770 [bacterium]|nr:hypothetical protein [bacterium]
MQGLAGANANVQIREKGIAGRDEKKGNIWHLVKDAFIPFAIIMLKFNDLTFHFCKLA